MSETSTACPAHVAQEAEFPVEPFRIRMVEPIRITKRAERVERLRKASYNLYRLASDDVMVDLLTDSGTGAMSGAQWAAMFSGDESYAGAYSFYRLEEAVRELCGYRHVIPTHQGRAAEALLFGVLGVGGRVIPNNTHFDTTRANIILLGGEPLDLPCREGDDLQSDFPFKGNIDLERLESLLAERAADVRCVVMTITNNAVGGQPVSLDNMAAARCLTQRYGVPLFLDACRYAENACLARAVTPALQTRPLSGVARDYFDLADGCLMSAKKDGLVNIGGLLALNDDDLAAAVQARMVVTEGFPTYGGLAGRDLEALAVGLREGIEERYMEYRIGVVRWLARTLAEVGIPVVEPPGGHAVFVDARRMLEHIPPHQFPAQALACAIYVEGGVRAVEVGTFMFSGAKHDLVRLCIPHRLYTKSHLEHVVRTFREVATQRKRLSGFRILREPPLLRHFTALLEPVLS